MVIGLTLTSVKLNVLSMGRADVEWKIAAIY